MESSHESFVESSSTSHRREQFATSLQIENSPTVKGIDEEFRNASNRSIRTDEKMTGHSHSGQMHTETTSDLDQHHGQRDRNSDLSLENAVQK